MAAQLDLGHPSGAFLLGLSACETELNEADRQYVAALLSEVGVACESPEEGLQLIRRRMVSLRSLSAGQKLGFARGVLACATTASADPGGRPLLEIISKEEEALAVLIHEAGSEPQEVSGRFGWSGVSALDVVGRLVDGQGPALPSQKELLARWSCSVAHFNAAEVTAPTVRVELLRPDAVLPHKERISDSGYDLTLLYEKKRLDQVTLYGTGIAIEPPVGWYFDVVPRSSIIKRGFMLANNVGIIDQSYRGEILVPLTKIDPSASDLELPARVAQLIPRPIVHFPVEEVASLSSTDRGAGGFGSTGK